MPAVLYRMLAELGLPHHEMSCARPDLVIAARAPIGLGGPGRRDGPDLVVITVGAGLDTTSGRQRCSRRLPATCTTPGHTDECRRQNSRNSELSIPRIWS